MLLCNIGGELLFKIPMYKWAWLYTIKMQRHTFDNLSPLMRFSIHYCSTPKPKKGGENYSAGSDRGQRGSAGEKGHAGMGGGKDMARQRQKIDNTDRRNLEGAVLDVKRQAN